MTAYGPAEAAPPRDPETAPPQGPGVQPPFAAPPIDGDRTRVWVGLGVGAAAVLLCCLGGAAGIGGLMVTGVQALNEQAHVAVGSYLDALEAENFVEAYSRLCDDAQRRESVQQFSARVSAQPHVDGYTLRDADIADRIVLPADVRYDTGQQRTIRFVLIQDTETGELEVCGFE
jgi:hypothetical protein